MSYDTPASEEVIAKTAEALRARNMDAMIVEDRNDALAKLIDLIPRDSEVMTAESVTLEQIGLVELLTSSNNPWLNVKTRVFTESEESARENLWKRAASADYYIASCHALSEDGIIVQASVSGSQLPAFAILSPHAILVTGSQKIMPTEADAIRRVREYALPLEDFRQKSIGNAGSAINKLLITYGDIYSGRITVLIVKEKLGF
jgi:L-lactate utilization protein LutC